MLASAFLASSAQAKVLEIGDSGEVTVHDRPEIYLGPGVRGQVIAPAPPIRSGFSATGRGHTATPSSLVHESLNIEAHRNGLSPELVEAVAWQESRFNPAALSPKGAMGVMQLMPATARSLGVDPTDAQSNIRGGAAYLAQLLHRYNGDVIKALAAYNASPNAVDRHGGPPPFRETQAYVAAILDRMATTAASQAPVTSLRTH